MKIIAVIPARLSSTRLKDKVLLDICGKPMIQHVYNAISKSKVIDEIHIATDSTQVMDISKTFCENVHMTSETCNSGTERISELIKQLKDVDIIVNIQGDEPLIDSEAVDEAIKDFLNSDQCEIGTMATSFSSKDEFLDPNKVKVISDKRNKAIYFSRSPIPYNRESESVPSNAYLHVGVYIYKYAFLEKYNDLDDSLLESYEKLEQLRFIENGYSIHVSKSDYRSFGVDTEADLKEIRKIVKQRIGNG
jgi:3-deoxy-manno-octulosonate cytidylyltransferase (CMP-KDO synthetase)